MDTKRCGKMHRLAEVIVVQLIFDREKWLEIDVSALWALLLPEWWATGERTFYGRIAQPGQSRRQPIRVYTI